LRNGPHEGAQFPGDGDHRTAGVFAACAQGHVDWAEGTRAHQAGQLDRVTTVRFDLGARLFGDQRWGNDPADTAFLRELAGEPIATRSRLIDKDKLFAVSLQLPDELVDVALAHADGTQVDDFSVVGVRNVCGGDRLSMAFQADVERARVGQG
jgi:hypothetical protein